MRTRWLLLFATITLAIPEVTRAECRFVNRGESGDYLSSAELFDGEAKRAE